MPPRRASRFSDSERPKPPGSSSFSLDEDEQLRAFRGAILREVDLPADVFVIGQPVVVTHLHYDGNPRRGLTARCRREDGSEYVVSLADVRFGASAAAAPALTAYRRWLGLGDSPEASGLETQPRRQHKVAETDIDMSRPVDLVVLSVKERAARCRLTGSERTITLRAQVWDAAPGEILTVRPRKHWRYAGHPYISGEIASRRVDIAALGLAPLRLEEQGLWDPEAGRRGGEHEPLEARAKAVDSDGPRPMYEMERVNPGADPEDPDIDPLVEAARRKEAGDFEGAREILMKLLEADLRCLDAHAQLGDLVERRPQEAIRHYEIGARIGELSLASVVDGALPWGFADNRPFLRCMHGYGLCLWRLGRCAEAGSALERLLRLNPVDDQGIRLLLPAVQRGQPWQP